MAIKGIDSLTGAKLQKIKDEYGKNTIQKASKAKIALDNAVRNEPGEYDNSYAKLSDKLLSEYINTPNFSYDHRTDPMYAAYAESYKKAGEKAMRDTMARATELTGGYSSSYAQSAGAQNYSTYLDELNSIIPQLQDKAYQRYLDEREDGLAKIEASRDLDSDIYEKHRDKVKDYKDKREYYTDRYEYERELEDAREERLAELILEIAEMENEGYYKDLELLNAQRKLGLEEFKTKYAN